MKVAAELRLIYLKNDSGISLVEIVVTLVIVAVVASIAMISINSSQADRDLAASAAQLEQDLRWMQQASINSASSSDLLPTMTFGYDSSAGKYFYIIQNSKVPKATLKPIAYLPKTIKFNPIPAVFYFDINGQLGGSTYTVCLQEVSNSAKVKYVIIQTITDRIRISDNPPS